MFTRRLFAGYIVLFLVWLTHFQACTSNNKNSCPPFSCGNLPNITSPFRLETDPKHSGDQKYSISCDNKNRPFLKLFSGKYIVKSINYNNFTIRISDPGVQEHNCSSSPRFSLSKSNFTYGDPYVWYNHIWTGSEEYPSLSPFTLTFLNCEEPTNSPLYLDTSSCFNGGNSSRSSVSQSGRYAYVNVVGMNASDLNDFCRVEWTAMLPAKRDYRNMSYGDIINEMAYGFELSWYNINCNKCRFKKYGCYFSAQNRTSNACGKGKTFYIELLTHSRGDYKLQSCI